MSSFQFNSWRTLFLDIEFNVDNHCLSALKNDVPVPFWCHCFEWEICCHSNCYFLIGNISLLYSCFQDMFFFNFWKKLCKVFYMFIFFGILSGPCTQVYIFCQTGEIFSLISLTLFHPYILPLLELQWHRCWIFDYCPRCLTC